MTHNIPYVPFFSRFLFIEKSFLKNPLTFLRMFKVKIDQTGDGGNVPRWISYDKGDRTLF